MTLLSVRDSEAAEDRVNGPEIMRTRKKMKALVILVMCAVLLAGVASAFANTHTASTTIPKNTVVSVVLDKTVSSKTNKTGDRIHIHCVGPNCGGFPSGTSFVGILNVTAAKEHHPGTLSAKFTEAILPDGRKIQVDAEPSSAEGVKKGAKSGKENKTKGKVTGGLVGRGIGSIIGPGAALAGGAAGVAVGGSAKGEGRNVEVKAGTKGHIVLLKPVTIPPNKSSGKS